MLFPKMILFLLTLTPQFPATIYMTNGNAFHPGDDYLTLGTSLRFRNEQGILLSIQYRQIDFERTFRVPKKPPAKKPAYKIQREIPWEHPHYRDKKERFYSVEITTDNLNRWASDHAAVQGTVATNDASVVLDEGQLKEQPPDAGDAEALAAPPAAQESRGRPNLIAARLKGTAPHELEQKQVETAAPFKERR